jgi:hypothetical protein
MMWGEISCYYQKNSKKTEDNTKVKYRCSSDDNRQTNARE